LTKVSNVGGARLPGIVDLFNAVYTENWSSYGTSYGTAAHLKPQYSSALFYQPRQVQFGVRVTY
jgi:hypothetical protein